MPRSRGVIENLPMIALLGSSGYIGTRFRNYMDAEGLPWTAIRRSDTDTFDAHGLTNTLSQINAEFLINCAGYTGKPNVDACEDHKAECLMGNAVLPGTVAKACESVGIPFGHVSSGCIFTGVRHDGRGFSEEDRPNFSFRQNNCSFYSGTKALGEEALADARRCFIWRPRVPFDNTTHPRNYLQKLLTYERLLEAENSLTQLDDFVRACIDCYRLRIPFGIYNLTNPGSVRTSEITRLLQEYGIVSRNFSFFADEAEFMAIAARAPRSNCVLDSSKAVNAGLRLSPIEDALRCCLASWEGKRTLIRSQQMIQPTHSAAQLTKTSTPLRPRASNMK